MADFHSTIVDPARKRGWGRNELADRAGLNHDTVGGFLRGADSLSWPKWAALAQTLGVRLVLPSGRRRIIRPETLHGLLVGEAKRQGLTYGKLAGRLGLHRMPLYNWWHQRVESRMALVAAVMDELGIKLGKVES